LFNLALFWKNGGGERRENKIVVVYLIN